MKRRGFLGFLGGAAVAGPSMAKAAAVQGMEAMSLGNAVGIAGIGNPPSYYGTEAGICSAEDFHPTDPRHWAQRQLSEFLGRSAEDLREQRMRTHVSSLDPDLAVNRSFSLSAKIRMQRDRNFERDQAEHRSHIMRDIKNAMKNWSERVDRH